MPTDAQVGRSVNEHAVQADRLDHADSLQTGSAMEERVERAPTKDLPATERVERTPRVDPPTTQRVGRPMGRRGRPTKAEVRDKSPSTHRCFHLQTVA